ncbi:MAG: papain-like cysteine protease family protein [Sagittula sp.]|uniref:papain-like cysteine protease family protein n=1 Tax=Sagittula sp. TaxID=2038081 RepID=UPI004057F90C
MSIIQTIYVQSSVGRNGRNKAADVAAVQSQLNAQMSAPRVALVEDGICGTLTRAAIYDFQKCVLKFNNPDSRVDPNGRTLAALNDAASEAIWKAAPQPSETIAKIHHKVKLIPQPTGTSCWAAATAMLLDQTVAQVKARTPASMILPDGSLDNFSGENDWVTPTREYAKAHGLQYIGPQSWSVTKLRTHLRRGPLIFDMLEHAGPYSQGMSSSGHWILVTGLSGERDTKADISYNDPFPVGRGAKTTENYAKFVQEYPARTYRVFHK